MPLGGWPRSSWWPASLRAGHSGIRLPARTMAGAQRGRSAPELLSPGSAIGSRSHLHEGLGNDPGRFERAVI
jgi:hypothetical protein